MALTRATTSPIPIATPNDRARERPLGDTARRLRVPPRRAAAVRPEAERRLWVAPPRVRPLRVPALPARGDPPLFGGSRVGVGRVGILRG
ncbi:hypothetical protein GCM10025867_25720 [Frondihabitans sucicola]|uniref:Uncharacterized protein n=1 Tax=Frondihabitans sucicola TaxID=1268041 RepID=A0ABM8GPE4_9MICO|nr:hypothetical protein GCM10025867_25720 [Frondihabitans sucicola]